MDCEAGWARTIPPKPADDRQEMDQYKGDDNGMRGTNEEEGNEGGTEWEGGLHSRHRTVGKKRSERGRESVYCIQYK